MFSGFQTHVILITTQIVTWGKATWDNSTTAQRSFYVLHIILFSSESGKKKRRRKDPSLYLHSSSFRLLKFWTFNWIAKYLIGCCVLTLVCPPRKRTKYFCYPTPHTWFLKNLDILFECCGVPDRDGALRFATVSPGESVSTRPFFEFKNLPKKFSPQLSIASRSPFDKARELLMREPHISLSDLHRFHEHSTQRLEIF